MYQADYCVKCMMELEYEFDFHPAGSTFGIVPGSSSKEDYIAFRKARIEHGWTPPNATDEELKVVAKVAEYGDTIEILRKELEWYESMSTIVTGEMQENYLLIAKHLRKAMDIILGYISDE